MDGVNHDAERDMEPIEVPGGAATLDRPHRLPAERPGPEVEIVIPVYNEERDLGPSVRRLHAYLQDAFPWSARITIADNASTDATWPEALRLAQELPGIEVLRLERKGRGNALRTAWLASDAAVVAYMDVDLSTDLAALPPLVAPLISGHSDLAIGSRLGHGSRVVRGPKREFISRSYNLLLRTTLRARFSDAQCGFKAMRADRARDLLPLVEDGGWFFDTELLVLAERAGLRIHEVPVDWVDDPDSRVDIVATAMADLRGIGRLAHGLATGRLPVADLRRRLGRTPLPATREADGERGTLGTHAVRFVAVGIPSTIAYLLLFLLMRGPLGAQGANLAALAITQVANTAANRRFTFGIRGEGGAARSQVEGFMVFGMGLALTAGSLALLHALVADPARAMELTVLVVANLAATVARFVAFRAWVFHPARTR